MSHREGRSVTFKRSGNALLSAGDVEAGGGDGVVTPALQTLLLVHLLEQVVGAILMGTQQSINRK